MESVCAGFKDTYLTNSICQSLCCPRILAYIKQNSWWKLMEQTLTESKIIAQE